MSLEREAGGINPGKGIRMTRYDWFGSSSSLSDPCERVPEARSRAIFHRARRYGRDTRKLARTRRPNHVFPAPLAIRSFSETVPRNPRRSFVRSFRTRIEIIARGSRTDREARDCLVFFEAGPPVAATYRDKLFFSFVEPNKIGDSSLRF